MPEAYDEAAGRHWADAIYLREAMRLPNADHLAGLAAECAIKAALVRLPCFLGDDDRLQRAYQVHIETLWDRVLVQGDLQKLFPGLTAALQASNPFHDFAVDQRYDRGGDIAEEAVDRHFMWTKRLIGAVPILGSRGQP